jgi:hypothetical protein
LRVRIRRHAWRSSMAVPGRRAVDRDIGERRKMRPALLRAPGHRSCESKTGRMQRGKGERASLRKTWTVTRGNYFASDSYAIRRGWSRSRGLVGNTMISYMFSMPRSGGDLVQTCRRGKFMLTPMPWQGGSSDFRKRQVAGIPQYWRRHACSFYLWHSPRRSKATQKHAPVFEPCML